MEELWSVLFLPDLTRPDERYAAPARAGQKRTEKIFLLSAVAFQSVSAAWDSSQSSVFSWVAGHSHSHRRQDKGQLSSERSTIEINVLRQQDMAFVGERHRLEGDISGKMVDGKNVFYYF